MATISGKYLGNLCSEFTHNPSCVKINVYGNGNVFSPLSLQFLSNVQKYLPNCSFEGKTSEPVEI